MLLLLTPIAVYFNLFETFWRMSRAHDAWQLDKLFTVLILVSVGLALFSLRRLRDLSVEIERRTAVERELMRARDDAEAASKAKSQFLANISHEIRTPMNAILGMTELALDTDLQPEQRELLTVVRGSSESLRTLLADVLDFSTMEAGKLTLDPSCFPIRETLAETVRMLAIRAEEKGLEVIFRVAPDVPRKVIADQNRLRQIVINLLGNAIKFTPQGEVSLSISAGRLSETGGVLVLEVNDTGVGIPPAQQQEIFEAFVQGDAFEARRHGGTGLGLSIASELVRMMGGTLELESSPGEGSAFRFAISIGLPADAEPDPAVETLIGLPVLVVDGNATVRSLVAELLADCGARPSLADSTESALRRLADAVREDRPFRILLIDAGLAQSASPSLASSARRHPGLAGAVVAMVGSRDRHMVEEALRDLGVGFFVSKPMLSAQLLRVLERVVAGLSVSARDRQAAALASRPISVLVAEDNRPNQMLIERLLSKWGYTVRMVENGQEAVSVWAQDQFDIILMDLEMPLMGGFEATKAIRALEAETGSRIPIFALTAHALPEILEQCLREGMDGYLTKPLHSEDLRALIDDACAPSQNSPNTAPTQ